MKLLDELYEILKSANRPMTSKELADAGISFDDNGCVIDWHVARV